ncbi:MAG: chemotaxis protein CheA [Treponema sp.]|uniref:chemotaxis protein CheA n=1 Tax=Treponema sp. TaxID=166 RepID=UPI001B3F7173|nr:chemotaxis protein CheA [Treponema sp.]MBP5402559.1 chemotaxis protein CheA [Treponema sp.]MBR5933856.1 chemotaxis protein CheA [Treponema sp.]
MFDQVASVFFDEANELLDNLEGYLLTLETEPENQEVISAVFRSMHTIKGSSAMFGFDEISKFTHKMESTFDMVRNGIVPVTPQLINLTLKARDHIRSLLGAEITPELQNASQFIIEELNSCVEPFEKTQKSAASVSQKQNEAQLSLQNDSSSEKGDALPESTWRISFVPSDTIMQNGTRPELLVKELAEMGNATILTFADKIPPLSKLEEEKCYLYWDIILTTSKTENDIKDVFIFVDDTSQIKIEKINDFGVHKKIGEILISRKLITEAELTKVIEEQKKVGDLLVQKNVVSEQQIKAALAEQGHLNKLVKAKEIPASQAVQNPVASQTIRVNSSKLDQLVNLVGELVTFNARLSSVAAEIKNPGLQTLTELGEHLIFSLRDTSMDMRMLPIGTIFSRFRRLVHDLAAQLGKNIELVTEGADTELDKNVIEKLNDPLVHLIRNSCDHGIENPEIRAQLGKNATGTVKLSARHAGAFVLITISDDGGGLNKDAIYNKGVERGLIKANENLTDKQIFEMIFQPGFSTNKTVTSVSGRGVGMDVVKRDIDSLGGSVSVETERGKGSSFILKIPLTLAIIEGMLVQIGDNKYVVPVSGVEECIEYEPAEDSDFLCSHIVARDEYLPCINMRKYFEVDSPLPQNPQVVVVNDQSSKIGIIVDHIIGNHQTVIKPIGKLYKKIEGLSGSTILGDGSVALILDIFKLSDIIRKIDMGKNERKN